MTEAGGSSSEGVKVLTRKPLIESASWCCAPEIRRRMYIRTLS